MAASDSQVEWKWRRECPKFGGAKAEYKGWRGQVEDWLLVCGEEVKYPGVEIRLSLRGRALEIAEGINREEIKKEGGERIILKKLDEAYRKDTIADNYEKLRTYIKIERESGETLRDYIIRYEKEELECSKALGNSVLGGEVKGFHVLEQANLSDSQKQMVLAACGREKLEYSVVSEVMKRIFEGLGKKEESGWLGSEAEVQSSFGRGRVNFRSRGRGNRGRGRGGRNPLDKQGKVSVCVLCQSEWHWARECPENFVNKKKRENRPEANQDNERDEETGYVGEISWGNVEPWKEVDGILDTGCQSTVCGEL